VYVNIGQTLISAVPLSNQTVDPTDSVLWPYANTKKNSSVLNVTYSSLIQKAFQPKFWNSSALTGEGDTQMVKNFSLFWGLSIMLYESTLVSDDTPFDKYSDGSISALTTQQLHGFQVFNNNGGCVFCHKGAEFTGAATALKTAQAQGGLVEYMIMGDGSPALYDTGFYNIGVRPTGEDLGMGGLDPWNNPLSWSRQAKNAAGASPQQTISAVAPDQFNVETCSFQVAGCTRFNSDFRDAVDGSFKVPTLRNVELTGPYFHNGGTATLEQVIDFYNRGGDATGTFVANSTMFGPNPSNRAPAIQPLGLSAEDKASLVAFLKSLTDERVRWEMAPFDHPSLQVPNGHKFDENKVIPDGSTGYAQDEFLNLPAVGAAGRTGKKLPALQPFDAGLQ